MPVAYCATEAQAHTATAETHNTADPHHVGISPEMTVDPRTCTNPTNTITKPPQRPSSSSHPMHCGRSKDRRYKQVTIDDPPSEYYSSDEQDSDSEDDLN